jgi:hypothetical protein
METPRIESLNETQKRLLAEEILAHADMVRHAQEATEAAQDQTDIRHDQLLELFEKIPPDAWECLSLDEQQVIISNLPK